MHVTVIMPVYNSHATLKRAIQSIIEQDFTDWDLIVIDDCSTDGSKELLADFVERDSRISMISHEKRMGTGYCLHSACLQARGELIARMDADDWSFAYRLSMQERFLREHPEVDVLGGAAELFSPDGRSLGVSFRPERHEDLRVRMYRENPFIHPTIMARKKFFLESGGYNKKLRWVQDLDLWLRTYRTAIFHNLKYPLVRYTFRPQPVQRSLHACRVLLFHAWRESLLLSKGWYAPRHLIACLLLAIGIRGVKGIKQPDLSKQDQHLTSQSEDSSEVSVNHISQE